MFLREKVMDKTWFCTSSVSDHDIAQITLGLGYDIPLCHKQCLFEEKNFKCFSILQICTRHEFCTFPGSDPDFFQMAFDQGHNTPSSYKHCLCEVRIYTVFPEKHGRDTNYALFLAVNMTLPTWLWVNVMTNLHDQVMKY